MSKVFYLFLVLMIRSSCFGSVLEFTLKKPVYDFSTTALSLAAGTVAAIKCNPNTVHDRWSKFTGKRKKSIEQFEQGIGGLKERLSPRNFLSEPVAIAFNVLAPFKLQCALPFLGRSLYTLLPSRVQDLVHGYESDLMNFYEIGEWDNALAERKIPCSYRNLVRLSVLLSTALGVKAGFKALPYIFGKSFRGTKRSLSINQQRFKLGLPLIAGLSTYGLLLNTLKPKKVNQLVLDGCYLDEMSVLGSANNRNYARKFEANAGKNNQNGVHALGLLAGLASGYTSFHALQTVLD